MWPDWITPSAADSTLGAKNRRFVWIIHQFLKTVNERVSVVGPQKIFFWTISDQFCTGNRFLAEMSYEFILGSKVRSERQSEFLEFRCRNELVWQ